MTHERERRRPGEATAAPGERESPAPHALLSLQRSAGNRAVSAMLARDPAPKAPPSTAFYVDMPSVGRIPIVSYQLSLTKRRPGDEDKDKKDEGDPGEIRVMSEEGEHSVALARAAVDGRAEDVVLGSDRGGAGVKFHCKGALVSSYSVSPHGDDAPIETWTLNCTAIKAEYTVPKNQ
jgi:hypothetical protein